METKLNVWVPDKELWDKLDIATLRLSLEQAEKRLASTITRSDKITTRAYALLTTTLILLTPLISKISFELKFCMDKLTPCSQDVMIKVIPYIMTLMPFLWVLWITYFVITPRNLYSEGIDPKYFEKIIKSCEGKSEITTITYSVVKECRRKILFNDHLNSKRTILIQNIIELLLIAPILFCVYFLILNYYRLLI